MSNLFDAANAPTIEPDYIVKGDLVRWRKKGLAADNLYPSSAYTAAYVARDATGASHEFTVNGTADGNDWLFTILSATSAAFDAGHHHWQFEITRTSDSERLTLQRGSFDVFEDYDTAGIDPRTHAEKMLTKIEAVLIGRADADVLSYSINGRSLSKMSPDDLIQWRDYYRREVAQEKRKDRIKNGKQSSASVLVRF